MEILLLELKGFLVVIGEVHGELICELVREYVEWYCEWIFSQLVVLLDDEKLLVFWQFYIVVNEVVVRDLVEEMEGIVWGVGVFFEYVFQVNSLLDIGNFCWLDCVCGLVGCTSFVVLYEHGSGEILLGQIYDLVFFWLFFNVLFKLQLDDGFGQLVYLLVGMVGCVGLNEYGLGVNINYFSSNDCWLGKLYVVVV